MAASIRPRRSRLVTLRGFGQRALAYVALLLIVLAAVPVLIRHAHAAAGPHLQASPALINQMINPGEAPIQGQQITLTNSGGGSAPLNWSLGSSLPSWLALDQTTGSIAAGSSEFVYLSFRGSLTTFNTFETRLTFVSSNADNSPVYVPVSISVGSYSRTWFFAAGSTATGYATTLSLANPNPTAASVYVEYFLDGGQQPLGVPYSVLGNSRLTVDVNQAVGPGTRVAMSVTSDQPIIAERGMHFVSSVLAGRSIAGVTDVIGSPQLGTGYSFAYIDTTPNHETDLTVLNLNSVPIEAQVNYYPAAGGQPTPRVLSIPARSPKTFSVNDEGLGSGTFSATVALFAASDHRTTALGLVERSMYLVDPQTGASGATDDIGVNSVAYGGGWQWYFADGYTSSQYNERFVIANPFSATAARATVTFWKPDGTSAQWTGAVQPGQQVFVSASAVLGLGAVAFSAEVTADQQVLAERVATFWYTGALGQGTTNTPIQGATDVFGVQQTSDLYYFGDGSTTDQYAEYLAVGNPGTVAVRLTLTLLLESAAAPIVTNATVGPTSHLSLLINKLAPSQPIAMIVQATGPIVAERTLYAQNGGIAGGSSTVGFAPHVFQPENQGFGFGPLVTTDSPNAGVLDATTGLLETNFPVGRSLDGTFLVDPYNSATTYIESWNQAVELNGNSAIYYTPVPGMSLGGVLAISGQHLYVGLQGFSGGTCTCYLDALYTPDLSVSWSAAIDTAVDSAPVIVAGTVYAETNDALYAISDTNGQVLWHATEPALPLGYSLFFPAVAGSTNGLVYFRTRTFQSSSTVTDSIEGLSAATGALQWSRTIPSGGSALYLSADGSTLYADDDNGTIYALDPATGASKWTAAGYHVLAVGNGLVVTDSFPSSGEAIVALNASTGAKQWQYPLPTGFSLSSQVFVTLFPFAVVLAAGPLAAAQTIFSLDGNSGRLNWQFQTVEVPFFYPFGPSLPMLGVGGSVYYATTSQSPSAVFVYGINATTGAQSWKTELDVPPSASPVFGGMTVPH